jgi:hypothetical protein
MSRGQQNQVDSILDEIENTFQNFKMNASLDFSTIPTQIDHQYAISIDLLDIALQTSDYLNAASYQYSHLLGDDHNMKDYEKLEPLIVSLKKEIGAKQMSLCVMYPEKGYVSWHHNSDLPGPNVRFHWSETGDGQFVTYDEKQKSYKSVPDKKGWTASFGHFVPREGILYDMMGYSWHAMTTNSKRFTLGFIF